MRFDIGFLFSQINNNLSSFRPVALYLCALMFSQIPADMFCTYVYIYNTCIFVSDGELAYSQISGTNCRTSGARGETVSKQYLHIYRSTKCIYVARLDSVQSTSPRAVASAFVHYRFGCEIN